MTLWKITQSKPLEGSLRPPSSKSQTLRAFLFACLSEQGGIIEYPLESQDALAMKKACEKLGASFKQQDHRCLITPIKNPLTNPLELDKSRSFSAGNSGIVWRFLAGVLSTRKELNLLWGDNSILNRRPMCPLTKALEQVGVSMWQTEGDKGPCVIKGPWKSFPEIVEIEGFDSQPVSALLIASALQKEGQKVSIKVNHPREIEWAHLTVHWLRLLGAKVQASLEGDFYRVEAGIRWQRLDYTVPVDYSSAAFLIGAGLISKGKLRLRGLVDDPQPDKALISILIESGASLAWGPNGDLLVDGSCGFDGFEVDIRGPIDLLPMLMTLGCFARTASCIRGISGARLKESDRVSAMALELSKMGAELFVGEDEVRIKPSTLVASKNLKSHHDHRIAMSLAVASLGTLGESVIHETEWAAKTYPEFALDLQVLGAAISVEG